MHAMCAARPACSRIALRRRPGTVPVALAGADSASAAGSAAVAPAASGASPGVTPVAASSSPQLGARRDRARPRVDAAARVAAIARRGPPAAEIVAVRAWRDRRRSAPGPGARSRCASATPRSSARPSASASCAARAAGSASRRRSCRTASSAGSTPRSGASAIERTRWSIHADVSAAPSSCAAPASRPPPARRGRPPRLADADRPLRRHRQALRRRLRPLLRLLHPGALRHPAEHPAGLDGRQPDGDPRHRATPRRSARRPRPAACAPPTSDLRSLMRRVPAGTPVAHPAA